MGGGGGGEILQLTLLPPHFNTWHNIIYAMLRLTAGGQLYSSDPVAYTILIARAWSFMRIAVVRVAWSTSVKDRGAPGA